MKIPFTRIQITQQKRKRSAGEVPGVFDIKENAIKSKIYIFSYNDSELDEFECDEIENAIAFMAKFPNRFHWMDIKGLGTQQTLDIIQKNYGINILVMEDIVNTYQRPKVDIYDNYLFVVSRMLELSTGLNLKNEQLSFIVFDKLIISFQEDYDDVLDVIRNRLRKNVGGNIRKLGPSYLLYALMDAVIDNYFNIVNRFSDELELIEDHLYQKPNKFLMYRIQGAKKILISLRRAIWPERDKLNELIRDQHFLINDESKVFLKDAYDHAIQIIDLIESNKEIAAGLLDLYLSLVSNRMNEVMKFLTLISAIFIPLTFVAGIYGMNFSYQDPKTGKIFQSNMPELYWENGYLFAWILMLAIAAFQIFYFSRRGWFKN